LKCPRYSSRGYYTEDNQGQGVVPYWKREKISWCGCKGKEKQSSTQARDSRGTTREEKAAYGQENWKAQQKRGVVNRRLGEPSKC